MDIAMAVTRCTTSVPLCLGYQVPLQSPHRGRRATRTGTGPANREIFEIKILTGVVRKDHVHILVSAPPHMAPSEIMRRIKGRSSSKLFEEFPLLKKRYWGRQFWARGYFCATVG